MLKKAFFLLITVGLLQCLITACCPDPVTFYSRITGLLVENYNLQTVIADSARVSPSDYRIKLTIEEETFAKAAPKFDLFPSAYATSCENEYGGIQSEITSLSISASKDIMGTPAGQPIGYDQFRVYSTAFLDEPDNDRITIEEWLAILNSSDLYTFEWFFAINRNIETEEFVSFRISLEQADGSTFEVETGAVGFE